MAERTLTVEVIRHHLALMGWAKSAANGAPVILDSPSAGAVVDARQAIAEQRCVVAMMPDTGFCAGFGIRVGASRADIPAVLAQPLLFKRGARSRLRTLHSMITLAGEQGEALVDDGHGEAVWWWLPAGTTGLLLIGTALADDLIRYRQGDPAQAAVGQKGDMWGYAGERPNYLFEPQREGEPAECRHADEWAWFLANVLAERTGTSLEGVLPGNAPGAIVITGDDDQAALDCYREQLEILGDTPITYFLHPKTKHTSETLASMLRKASIDLGLHPDALDAPNRYADLLHEQAGWFRNLTGLTPRSLRNHGFLNRGYWGHLDAWLAEGVVISANLPGIDGSVINGSLLPARIAYEGTLSKHWSTLTAIGDGVLFIQSWGPERAAECIFEAASRIRDRGIPGVLVINLHPENVRKSAPMHRAAMEVIESGFVAWNMRDCLNWFAAKDMSVL